MPIPGSTKAARITETLGAAQVTLSAQDRAALTAQAEAIPIVSLRDPEAIDRTTDL